MVIPGRFPDAAAGHGALCEQYDVAMFDLDGVLYIGSQAVPGAAEHVRAARGRGLRCAYVTNNAARPPGAVAEHLRELGIPAEEPDVVTSAQAAARLLVDRLGRGARVVLLGAEGLGQALDDAGLQVVGVEDDADAVATGYGPQVRWGEVMRAAVRIREGLCWVASNRDLTIPTAYGTAPGHGVLVETIARYSGVMPLVAGKPEPPLLRETIERTGARRPLMVGDRLDTDIEGANALGIDSLLVMTGVTGPDELRTARVEERPTYVADDLSGLLEAPGAPDTQLARWRAWTSAAWAGE